MKNAPFGDCDKAELHLGDQIQATGALVVIDRTTQTICACSANTLGRIGVAPATLLGASWRVAFSPDQVDGILNPLDAPGNALPRFVETTLNGKPVVIVGHTAGAVTLLEIEDDQPETWPFSFADTTAYLGALAATDTVEEAAALLMNTVARITQFDRVMLYKFLPQWHGEVIAENLRSGVEGFLGLRFPATDLPANARRLYLLNWKRAIADVDAPTAPILATPDCETIDFTYSQLRAVHPSHIQYLKNIGTVASFSISLVLAGNLWGLIACHHLTAKKVSAKRQQLCEQLSRMTSIHMADLNAMRVEKLRSAYREAHAEIRGALKAQDHDKLAIGTQLAQIRHIFNAQGAWAQIDGHDYHSGELPDAAGLAALQAWLGCLDKSGVTARSAIDPSLAEIPALVRFASGVLYIPFSEQDFLVLMRPEQVETVNWAGKPQCLSAADGEPPSLTPRASFQLWSQAMRGASAPWVDVDVEAATKLRELLIEHIEDIHLEGLALHDPLTGLANRHLFERKLQEAINLSIRDDGLSAVYMLDLDKFKPVNDTMGHAAGDELLVKVAERLTAIVRERDVVARLGGDEFAIVQFHLSDAQDAAITAERIVADIRRPFSVQGQNIEIGVSIGIAICPYHAAETHEMVQNADLALYQAKHAGRNTFRIFKDNMLSTKEQKESVRISLVNALAAGEFFLEYQPIVDAKTRTLKAFEAFARWRHPEKGTLRAATFMPQIEQYQLAVAFAEWGIRQVAHQHQQWHGLGLPIFPIGLNMSASQFLNLDVAGLCSTIAAEYGIGLDWLRFDLDEAALQTDFQRAADKIAALARIGVLTNVDHFGEGAITLKRMLNLKLNCLKVPGKLFRPQENAPKNDTLSAIISAIGRLIHTKVVATQVESAVMERHVTDAGIEFIQGNSVSRALTAENVEKLLRNKTSAVQLARAARGTSAA